MIAMRAAVQRMIPQFRRGSVAFEALVVASTAATTAVVTYRIASKRIEAAYAQKLDDELEATRKFYAAFHEKPSIAELVEDAGLEPAGKFVVDTGLPEGVAEEIQRQGDELLRDLANQDPRPDLDLTGKGQKTQYNKVVKQYTDNEDANTAPVFDEPAVNNIFAPTDTLTREEIDNRSPSVPYILTQDEFIESDLSPDTLTYYAEDGVLADSQGMPFDNVDRLVGEVNLQRFGVGSGDKRIVYVRNEAIDQDWEIVLHDGSYAEIVAGLRDEPETPRRRRITQDE